MKKYQNLLTIFEELSKDANKIDANEIENVEKLILSSNRIFVAGAGRSGYVGRALANRLMHVGFTVYFVGDTTTPSIRENDLLIIGSGSGETQGLITMAKNAKKQKAHIATFTVHPENSIGSLADAAVKIPGVTARANDELTGDSIQVKGSSFEQLCLVIYDSIIIDLRDIKKQTQDDLDYRHANLE